MSVRHIHWGEYMSKLNRILWSGLVLIGAACGDDVTVTPPPEPPTPGVRSVSVAPDGANLPVGSTLQMTAAVTLDPGATGAPTITWSSSDNAKATVSATGLVTGVAAGSVGIRATATLGTSSGQGVATINVVGAATCVISGVSISPTSASITVGQTLALAPSVNGTNCVAADLAVTYTSGDPAIATVSAAGVVTGVAGGTTTIVIKSVKDATKQTAMSVEVTVPTPATLSIQSVTQGSLGTAVNLANVGGQIEVTLNVDRGDKVLDRVDVLIGGQVVASQTFTTSPTADAAAPEASAPVPVVQSVNTRQVTKVGTLFIPVIFNGQSFITANLYVVGTATPTSSNAVPVLMNNSDGGIAPTILTDVATAAPEPFVDGGARNWFKGNFHTAFNYIAFSNTTPTGSSTALNAACGGQVSTVTGTPTTGISVDNNWVCAGIEAQRFITGPFIGGTTWAVLIGPDGSALRGPDVGMLGVPPAPPIVPVGYSEVGGQFTLPGNLARWNLITPSAQLPSVCTGASTTPQCFWVDNLAPAVEVAGPASTGNTKSQIAFNALFDQPWIGLSYLFSTSNLAAPPAFLIGDLFATDGGTGVKATYPRARQITGAGVLANPFVCGAESAGSVDLPQTLTSNATDGLRITAFALDNLDNASPCGGVGYTIVSNYFGVDIGAPTARVAGSSISAPFLPPATVPAVSAVANTTIFGMGPGFGGTFSPFDPTNTWGLEGLDDRSGFDQAFLVPTAPASQSLTWLWPGGPPPPAVPAFTSACVAPLAPVFTNAMSLVQPDNFVRTNIPVSLDCASGNPGYYTYTGFVTDRAGNKSTTVARNFAIDQYAPPIANSVNLASVLYTAGQPANFAVFGSDDLEVIESRLRLTYPTVLGPTVVGYLPSTVGTRWDATLTNLLLGQAANITYLVGRLDLTCTGAGAPYAGCLVADGVTAGGGPLPATEYTPTTNDAQNPTAVQALLADVASDTAATPLTAILSLQVSDVAQMWVGPGIDLQAWRIYQTAVANPPPAPPSQFMNGEHKASTSIVIPYFDQVYLARNVGGVIVVCAQLPAPTLSDNGINRFWTYSMQEPGTGVCADAGGGTTWHMVGVKSGAALLTTTGIP